MPEPPDLAVVDHLESGVVAAVGDVAERVVGREGDYEVGGRAARVGPAGAGDEGEASGREPRDTVDLAAEAGDELAQEAGVCALRGIGGHAGDDDVGRGLGQSRDVDEASCGRRGRSRGEGGEVE